MKRKGLIGVLALMVAACVPPVAGASSGRLFFDTSAHFSGVDVSDGQGLSGSFHQVVEKPVQASLAGHEPLCRAYAQGKLMALPGGRLAVVSPGISGTFTGPRGTKHTFGGFAIYIGARGRTGPGTYRYSIDTPDGSYPNDPFDQGKTNEPFQIDHDRYLKPVGFTVTLRKNGSGKIVEQSPHSYEQTWTCSDRPPISFSVLNAKGQRFGDEGFRPEDAQLNTRLTLAGDGFDPRGGPIELFVGHKRLARLHATERFRFRYKLEHFPNFECSGTFRAVQGSEHPRAEFAVERFARVVAAQGGVRTRVRALDVGDLFCAGQQQELDELRVGGVKAGRGVIIQLEQGGGAHLQPGYTIVSHPRGAREIAVNVLIRHGRRLVVQMPEGEFQADGPGGNPNGPPGPDPECPTLPAQAPTRVTISGCNQAPQSVHLNGGADFEANTRICGQRETSLAVNGTIVIHNGVTITGRSCSQAGGNSAPVVVTATDGSVSIDGGILDRTPVGQDMEIEALGSIVLHG